MHIKTNHFLFPALISFILLFSSSAHATIKEVTLFPNSAKVVETAKIHPQCSNNEKCRAILTIPSQADPESLIVSLPAASRIKIDDIQMKAITRQDEARISGLRKQISKLKNDRKDLQAKLQALDVQLQFWQMQTKAKTKTVSDADNLAAAIGRNVKKSSQEKFVIEAEIEKIDKQLKELQDSLNQAAGSKETAWEATLTFSGQSKNEIVLSYNYNLGGCGWLPLYRIEALPAENRVSFSWDAQLWQSSGEDWKQVQINLATLQPAVTAVPPDLPDWIIKKRSPRVYKSMREESMAPRAMMERKSLDTEEPQNSAAEETIKTTYSSWSIGKKTIAAGDKQRLKIKEEIWPADFLFLARPSLNQQAFVRAQVKFANSVEIPPGEALFLIEGAVLGKRNFAFAGAEGTLYFGTSPLISVTSSTLADKAGAKTVFQNKQTQLWQWLIEAKNSSGSNIKLRIEEPVPQARDERIQLTFKQNPEPLEKDHTKFVWIVEVPARQKMAIQNTIELEAPKDLDLDLGWRR
ncbi:MAG: mucoidy inhibitor MuiA family protein [Smithellaceae bacterium]